jgi:hypothetical protein
VHEPARPAPTNFFQQNLLRINHGLEPIETCLLYFAADYADTYEVLGLKRKARGVDLKPQVATGEPPVPRPVPLLQPFLMEAEHDPCGTTGRSKS